MAQAGWKAAHPPVVGWTIAGHDPSSGAGITADLQTFAAHGIFGVSAITALTAQSTRGVAALQPVGAAWLETCLQTLWHDLPPAGVKIGMLASAANARTVEAFSRECRGTIPIVLDPVLRASSGAALLEGDREALGALLSLLGSVDWVTPNWAELEVLSGLPAKAIRSLEGAGAAAEKLGKRFASLNIAVTGGESHPPVDLLRLADGSIHRMAGERIETGATHGTGCAFSSALLCGLMRGLGGLLAATQAKRFVEEAMRRAPGLGSGPGPMALLWPLAERVDPVR